LNIDTVADKIIDRLKNMQASISKSEVLGKAAAPSSKSYTIRGLICGALADGKVRLFHH